MRRVWLFLACLVYAVGAIGQTGTVQGHSFLGGTKAVSSGLPSTNYLNGIIPSATITVYLTGTQTKATIFSDGSSHALSNPFTSNAVGGVNPGGYIFWAATGQGYDVVASGGISPNTYAQPVTLLVDEFPGAAGGGGPVVEVNGTPISPSSPANFVDTASVTWAFTGGQIQATAAGGGSGPCVFTNFTSLDCEYNTVTIKSITNPIDVEGTNGGYLGVDTSTDAHNIASQFAWDTNGNTVATSGAMAAWGFYPGSFFGTDNNSTQTGTVRVSSAQGLLLETNSPVQDSFRRQPIFTYQPIISTPPIVLQGSLGLSQSVIGPYITGWTQTATIPGFVSVNGSIGFTTNFGGGLMPAVPQFYSCNLSITCVIATGGNGPGTTPPLISVNYQSAYIWATISGSTCDGGIYNGTWPVTVLTPRPVSGRQYDINTSNTDTFTCPSGEAGTLTITPQLGAYGEQVQFLDATKGGFNSQMPPADEPLTGGLTAPDNINGGEGLPLNYTASMQMWIGRYDSTGNTVTITPYPGDTINGSSSPYTPTMAQYGVIHFLSDGNHNWYVLGGGVGGGSNVTINGGSTLTTANFGSLPAAGANGINVTWQASSANISAEIIGDGNAGHFLNGNGGWTAPSGGSGLPCSGTCTAAFLPQFGASGTSVTNSLADYGVTTASTFTFAAPLNVAASSLPSQIALTYDSHAPTVGSSTTAVYAVSSAGLGELSNAGAAFSPICTTANGQCPGGSIVASAEVVSFSATPTFSTSFNVSRIVLTGNITSFTLGAGSDGQLKTLCFAQDATGSRTVTPPANVHGFFTPGTIASKWSCQSYSYDNTDSIWLASNTGILNE